MNENQDNNLQNSVENSTLVEPVEMPTPIEAQAPIDEAAPVESQAPVVEPTPVESQAPTVESTSVTPTPVVEPTPVAPTPVVEPTPVVTPPLVETPVAQPVASPVSPALVTPPTNEKKSNPVLVVLLIIALLAVIGYGVYSYTDILKPKANKGGNDTTTTTTTTSNTSDYAFESVNEYVSFLAKHKDDNTHLIQENNEFSLLNFDFDNKCVNDGDKVNFNIDDANISYTCEDLGYNQLLEKKGWEANVSINNIFSIRLSTYGGGFVYTNKNYYLVIDIVEDSIGNNSFSLYDHNGNVVLKDVNYTDHFMKDKNDDSINYSLELIYKDSILYFVSVDNDNGGVDTTCRLKAIDLKGTKKSEIKEIGTGTACYYNGY